MRKLRKLYYKLIFILFKIVINLYVFCTGQFEFVKHCTSNELNINVQIIWQRRVRWPKLKVDGLATI